MIPGSNLLATALSVIGRQSFIYYAQLTRTLNGLGKYVSTYAAGIPVTGSVQPVARTLYQAYGLDFQKNYYFFFVQQNIYDVARDISGDQFFFQGKNFQCESKTAWHGVDGWDQVLCVEVPSPV